MVSESRRDSVGGGGSSIIFPWSPKAHVIQWGGGGGVIADIFRRGGPGHQKAGSSRNLALMRHFYIFRLSQRGRPGPPLNRPLTINKRAL